MVKVTNIKPKNHDKCSVQFLGISYSSGVAKQGYFCFTHQEAFNKFIRLKVVA